MYPYILVDGGGGGGITRGRRRRLKGCARISFGAGRASNEIAVSSSEAWTMHIVHIHVIIMTRMVLFLFL